LENFLKRRDHFSSGYVWADNIKMDLTEIGFFHIKCKVQPVLSDNTKNNVAN
jgi:hypothetical protein